MPESPTPPSPAPDHGPSAPPPTGPVQRAPWAGQADAAGQTGAEAAGGPGPWTEQGHDAAWDGSLGRPGETVAVAGTPTRPRAPGWLARSWQALVAGAVAGAVIGAGTAWIVSSQQGTTVVSGGDNVVINDPESATTASAAAAKALPSSVTVSVTSSSQSGSGSGVVLDTEGHILTNQHVATLGGETTKGSLQVQLADGRVLSAELVGQDPLYDLAVLKVDAEGLTPITFSDMSTLNVGDVAVAIGAPMGLPNSVSDGIVSNLERSIPVASSAVPEGEGQDESPFRLPDPDGGASTATGQVSLNVVQTDAAINHGNSGGALVDAEGRLIGINVAIYSPSEQGGSIGLGFAIRADIAHRVADELIADGKASHGQLGVTVQSQSVTASGQATGFTEGAKVASAPSDSPAGRAGVRKGDVIVKVGDRRVVDATDVTATVRAHAGGEKVQLTVRRGDTDRTVEVTLGTASVG